MNPADKFTRALGETEPLSEELRGLLMAGAAAEKTRFIKPAVHKTGRPVRSWKDRPLTARQKSTLSRLAEAAFSEHSRLGLIDPEIKLDAWRKAESIEVAGQRISESSQSHYLPLRGHFLALAGKTEVSTFNDLTAPSDAPDRAAIAQALRTELARFAELPDEHGKPTGAHRAEAYLFSIAQHRGNLSPRTVGTIINTWSPQKIETLVVTLRNRISAKRGVGKTSARNKSQRKS